MIQTQIKGVDALKKDLAIIFLKEKDKKTIFKWTAGDIKKNAQSNINKQQSPTGEKWKPRSKPANFTGLKGKELRQAKKQDKMLKKRAQQLGHEITGSYRAVLRYKVLRTAQISQIHQDGLIDDLPPTKEQQIELDKWIKENLGKDKDGNKKGNWKDDPATAQQAQRLKKLGYTTPDRPNKKRVEKGLSRSDYAAIQKKWRERIKNGKNRHSASESEIMDTLTMGQAGLLIRLLDPLYNQKEYTRRYNARKAEMKKTLPKRQFLDTDDKRNGERMTKAILRYQKTKK